MASVSRKALKFERENQIASGRKFCVILTSVIDTRIVFIIIVIIDTVEMVDTERYFLAGDIHALEKVNKIVPRKLELPMLMKSSWVLFEFFFGFFFLVADKLRKDPFVFLCRYVDKCFWVSDSKSNISLFTRKNVLKNVLNFQFNSASFFHRNSNKKERFWYQIAIFRASQIVRVQIQISW